MLAQSAEVAARKSHLSLIIVLLQAANFTSTTSAIASQGAQCQELAAGGGCRALRMSWLRGLSPGREAGGAGVDARGAWPPHSERDGRPVGGGDWPGKFQAQWRRSCRRQCQCSGAGARRGGRWWRAQPWQRMAAGQWQPCRLPRASGGSGAGGTGTLGGERLPANHHTPPLP